MEPLVHRSYQLERFPGKGGWTYAAIPEILQDKHAHFGWVKVRGSIDGIAINQYHLMPMGNGSLFLPVKAAIRKQIGKQAGDWVEIILYPEDRPFALPEELLLCLSIEPKARENFLRMTPGKQKEIVDWIYAAKKEKTKDERIAITIEKALNEL
jgi:hypothetical protein